MFKAEIHERITKAEWYRLGGFANPSLYRKHNGRHWVYYRIHNR